MMVLVNICYTPRFIQKVMILSLARFTSRFTPHWRITVFGLLICLVFVRLGYWQLQRADEKKQILSVHHQLQRQVPRPWLPDAKWPRQYQSMKVQGHYLSMIIFQDNQHYQHQFGYHVISPLVVSPDKILLVDRGWVAGDVTRHSLPLVNTPEEYIHIIGSAYYPSKKSWSLGQSLEKVEHNMVVVERIDIQLISQILHKSVYPFIIRLDKHETQGFNREWPVVSMPPERHYGYALQWFGMALITMILIIILNIKKKHENSSS